MPAMRALFNLGVGCQKLVDQAAGYAKRGTIHQEIQLLMTSKEQNKNLELTANRKENKQTNVPAMKAVVRNILCTVI